LWFLGSHPFVTGGTVRATGGVATTARVAAGSSMRRFVIGAVAVATARITSGRTVEPGTEIGQIAAGTSALIWVIVNYEIVASGQQTAEISG
jgi:hypothetical protein